MLQNYTSDYITGFIKDQIFVQFPLQYPDEGFTFTTTVAKPVLDYLQGSTILSTTGLFKLIDIETNKQTKSSKICEQIYAASTKSSVFQSAVKPKYAFGIKHHAGVCEYDTRTFEFQNMDVVKMDFISLVRGMDE